MMAEHGVSPSSPADEWTSRDKNPFLYIRDGAVTLPSYQRAYAITIDGDAGRDFEDFPKHLKSATYLNSIKDPGKSCFWWPRFLYSIVNDALKPDEFPERIGWMVELSKWAEVTFDSGGYHVAQGKAHWTGERLAGTLWLSEEHAQFAIIMDHPTFTGHPFDACLEETVRNLNWLLDRRKGRCKWINVCQGSTVEQVLAWWAGVRHGNAEGLEGIAYAVLGMSLYLMLWLIRQQIDDGAFDTLERGHGLGRMKPTDMAVFTMIARVIRKHFNPDFQFTADSAAAFLEAGFLSQFFDGTEDQSGKLGSNVFSRLRRRSANSDLAPDTEIFLNSPVYPKGVPILMSEIGHVYEDGEQVANRLGMSLLATNNIWHQVTQIISAQEDVDAVLQLPPYHKFADADAADLLIDVANSLKKTGSAESAAAQWVAANQKIKVGGVSLFRHHDMEVFPILQEVVEEILVGDKPDFWLKKHKRLLTSWF